MIFEKALLWSGGLDSTLILAMLRDQKEEFHILTFREFWTKGQARRANDLIAKWNLDVIDCPTTAVSLIGRGKDATAIFETPFRVPFMVDLIKGRRCIATLQPNGKEIPQFKTYIVGSRKDDRHFDNKVIPSERWTVGDAEFYAPLFHWTRDDVKEGLRVRGLDASEATERQDTGNVHACLNCINGEGQVYCPQQKAFIPAIQWDREQNLANFRLAYGL